jgi:Tfp pilus assembly protein PilV
MKIRKRQAGFSGIEIALAIVVVVAIGVLGYTFYTNYKERANETVSTEINDVQSAPEITSSSDLEKAETTMEATELETSNTDDLENIEKDLSEF